MLLHRLCWIGIVVVLLAEEVASAGEPPASKSTSQATSVTLETVLELEQTARLLAVLLDSGRAVINEQQTLLNDERTFQQGLAPSLFERQLAGMFRSRAGIDLDNLDASKLPSRAKKLMKELVAASTSVVADAQHDEITQPNGSTGFIPAVFGSRVAGRFTERTGVRLKQTTLVPRNAANAPDPTERAALELFADPNYPREKVFSETTARSGTLRLMFPLYATRQCLDCHGEPKGALDRTGYPREGLKLGQNAGAISVMIPIAK